MITRFKSLFRRMAGTFKQRFEYGDIGACPIIHHFPDLGRDGQVSIDCIVRASSNADFQEALKRHLPDDRSAGVSPLRVGSMHVEIDEHGLRFRWEPAELADQSFLSPFGRTPNSKHSTSPTEQG